MDSVIVLVTEELADKRLDAMLSLALPSLSRSRAAALIDDGCVRIAGVPARKSTRAPLGSAVSVRLPGTKLPDAVAQDIPLDIRYEDDDLLVVNKPRGMVVHPAPGNCDGTLVNALLFHCGGQLSAVNGAIRPGIVHRIDKDTSGLLAVAKNDAAHLCLARQISAHTALREYTAVIHGSLPLDEGTVDAPIGRCTSDRKRMCVTRLNSRNAVTHYTVLERANGFSLVRLRLETGRTHQIRVHMAYLGHPVAGDPVYNGAHAAAARLNGQCLHAGLLGFALPGDGRTIEIRAEFPEYFTDFLEKIGIDCEKYNYR